jgi:Tol biopolymer transport system component
LTETAPRRFGPYEILEQLGAGGMGEVFRAYDPRLRRAVAIKILPAAFSSDPVRLQRFEQEAHAAAALNHPAILAVYDVGTEGGAPYLVTELLQGETLSDQLKRGPVPMRKAIGYAVQIARGLAAAHDAGIVHRDLKPANLFLTNDGRIKILDFGLAKLLQRDEEQVRGRTSDAVTIAGALLGTEGYMSPEQIRGLPSDHRADIFSFGIVLYEMLAGRRAFKRATTADTMSAILNEEPPDLTELIPNISPGLRSVMLRCLEKNPAQRFQSASDLAFALEALSFSSTAHSGVGVLPAIGQQKARTWIAWPVGLALLVAVIGLVWWNRGVENPNLVSVKQLTNDGVPKATDGALATDGARVYFNEGETNNWKIAQVSVMGGKTAEFNTSVRDPQVLAVTPDTSGLLVLEGAVEVGTPFGVPLSLLPLPAGEPRQVGELKAEDAAFFPDGRHIVYANGSGLYVAGIDGANSHKLADVSGSVGSPAVSPDGRRIRFTVWGNKTFALWEIAASGGPARQLLQGWHDLPVECCGNWTADGHYFVFQSVDENGWELWALRDSSSLFSREASHPVALTQGPLSYFHPLPSPKGGAVFAIGVNNRGELVRYDRRTQQFLPYLSGISATEVMSSRDGAWVVWLDYPGHTVWRSRSDGSERLQLSSNALSASYPRISPDGENVVFNGFTRTEGFRQYVVSMKGGAPRKIAEGRGSAGWSPDGRAIVFNAFVPGAPIGSNASLEVHTIDMGTGKESVIPDSQGKIGPFWTTPETLIAATADLAKFVTYNFKTGKWSDFAPGPSSNWFLSWDRKYLYCDRSDASGKKAIRIRLPDGHEEMVARLQGIRRVVDPDYGTWLGISDDGSILLTRDTGTQEIYALNVKWP